MNASFFQRELRPPQTAQRTTGSLNFPVLDREFWQVDTSQLMQGRRAGWSYDVTTFFTAHHQVAVTSNRLGELHAHTFRLKLIASVTATEGRQAIVPYESVREVAEHIARAYEGVILNDLPPFRNIQPTTENLIGVIALQLERLTVDKPFKIKEITLMESPTIGITMVT
jgi:6-pyruvoyltetrahydropterin/6-carboxytetrahydropterin synthase